MKHLSGKDKKNISGLPAGFEIDKKDEVIEHKNILWKNKMPYLIISENGGFIPHLKALKDSDFKSVYVDRGAIPFVLKGADLMRPGIQELEEGFEKDDIILVKDEEHRKTIAVAKAMFGYNEMKEMDKGKVCKIIHFVSDEYYNSQL